MKSRYTFFPKKPFALKIMLNWLLRDNNSVIYVFLFPEPCRTFWLPSTNRIHRYHVPSFLQNHRLGKGELLFHFTFRLWFCFIQFLSVFSKDICVTIVVNFWRRGPFHTNVLNSKQEVMGLSSQTLEKHCNIRAKSNQLSWISHILSLQPQVPQYVNHFLKQNIICCGCRQ